MTAGSRGTFVISCSQTEIDGMPGPPPEAVEPGSTWRWHGQALCVSSPADMIALDDVSLRRRAGRAVRRILGPITAHDRLLGAALDQPGARTFSVTDGLTRFSIDIIDLPDGREPLLAFQGRLPPVDADLWVVDKPGPARLRPSAERPGGVTCFGADTPIVTPKGPRLVQDLGPGDLVETCDNGPQPILWTGQRRLSAADLRSLPGLRPLRLTGGDGRVTVSQDHRVMLAGGRAGPLFNTPEVLVAARDAGPRLAQVDRTRGPVSYHHVMFDQHQVILAGGIPCESFHPADTDLNALPDAQRLGLVDVAPDAYRNPSRYGAHARRVLNRGEVAMLMHGAA